MSAVPHTVATPSKRRRAVVLVSGGLDSATCLAIARAEGFDCYALSFAYGQRHEAELAAAARVAVALGAVEQRSDGLWRWFHSTPQISRAYSPMVRSDENQPTLAIFMTAALRHASRSHQRRSTSRCRR